MPDGSNASIVDADQPLASFTPDVSGNYVLELEVDDGATDGTNLNVDRIIIRVSDENVPPNADAGENQSLESCTRVTLDGSGSFDPDSSSLSYIWRLVSAPEGSTANIAGHNTATSSFTPDFYGSYVLRLDVNDGENSSWDNVLVVVGEDRENNGERCSQ